MSNNLLNNTTSLQNILEALQNKATPSGEDVTDETSTYTEKLASLESAVTALETELEGKASGGSGEKVLCHAAIYLSIIDTYHCLIFEEGMTWNDFFESDYAYIYDNYDNIFINIGDLTRNAISDDQGIFVPDTAPIQNNGIYLGN